jgi:hypothetical protein
MKKIILLLFVGLLSFSANSQEEKATDQNQDANAPVFEFVTEIIDYGKIKHNADGVRVFKFKNVGNSPLIITSIKSTCGCTVPKKPTEPIMPGDTGEIEVKYATNRIGGFSKTITVVSNAATKVKSLRIKGIVLKPEPETDEVKKKTTASTK